ncbi:hypothetical protein SAMN05444972_101399 [Marininema halotolerans]|uniref:DUF2651 domain-containing protein n=2 Tax=Marininema halotolerans TaxID=1155944 RepID=A0A1I6P6Y9_9BACL|nr:hypothetical protein SAMN05444972_101399 [Marininema halotolerans]
MRILQEWIGSIDIVSLVVFHIFFAPIASLIIGVLAQIITRKVWVGVIITSILTAVITVWLYGLDLSTFIFMVTYGVITFLGSIIVFFLRKLLKRRKSPR